MNRVAGGLLAVGIALVAMVAPMWLVYAAGGVLIGAAGKWLLGTLRRSPLVRLAVFMSVGFACLLLLVVVVSIPSLLSARGVGRPIVATYSGNVRYEPQLRRWEVLDEVRIDFREEAYTSLKYGEGLDESVLASRMTQAGWQCQHLEERTATMVRRRGVPLSMRWYTARTTNALPLPTLAEFCNPNRVWLSRDSQVCLTVPASLIGRVDPPPSHRQEQLAAAGERIVVPIDPYDFIDATDGYSIHLEALHPLFRSRPVVWVRLISANPAVNWLIVAFFGAFTNKIQRRFCKPAVDALFRRLRWSKTSTGSAIPSVERHDADGSTPRTDLDQPAPTTPRRRTPGSLDVSLAKATSSSRPDRKAA